MKRKRIHAGLTLIEAGIVLMLVMLMFIAGAGYLRNSTRNLEYNATATQLNTVTAAGIAYIHDNYPDLSGRVSAGHPVIVTGQQLRDAGYLIKGYSLTNNSHQDYQVAVAVNPAFSDRLVAFVLTQNGTEIPFDGLRTITAYAGGMSGYVHDNNIAEGAYGGWKVTLTDYGLSAKTGHLASYISSDRLGNSAEAGDRLYRYSVDGHPGLNQMKTAIDMDRNNVDNAGIVSTQNLTAADSVTAANITADNTVNTNVLTASGDITAGGAIKGGTVRADGRMTAGETLLLEQVNTAGTTCSPNGQISRDADGAVLSCHDGIWSMASSAGWKAPEPQTISCSVPYNSYVTKTMYARVDEAGQLYTRMTTDSDITTDWVKGGNTPGMAVSIQGIVGFGHTQSCASHDACITNGQRCEAFWEY